MPINTSGKLSLLRVHDLGTKYGPANDQIDVEVVAQFEGRPADAYGFQLRDDAHGPARRGMFDLLRDGFTHDHTVHVDYDVSPGKQNGVVMRVWLTHASRRVGPVGRVDEPILDPSG